jgi:glyoxylase-like metal-dependent hydrolase (beta-lactamase superfamily II)
MAGPGHVTRGGDPLVQPLSPTVTLTKLSVGPMDNNAYLLRASTGHTLLIDAADDAETLLAVLGGLRLDVIVTTHRHRDHWQALSEVQAATSATLVCGRPDVDAVATGAWVENVLGVWDGDEVTLGDESLEVIGLVGHTPGSIALAYHSPGGVTHLFTGDSLFPGGPGKTGSPMDFGSLMNDLEHKVFGRFDDETQVHPGHGDDTTLGAERPQLGEWRARGW